VRLFRNRQLQPIPKTFRSVSICIVRKETDLYENLLSWSECRGCYVDCRSSGVRTFQRSKTHKASSNYGPGLLIVIMLSGQDIAQHASRESLWIIVENAAYDVTEYLDDHPGGATILLRYGGKVRMVVKKKRVGVEPLIRMQPKNMLQYIRQAPSSERYLKVCNTITLRKDFEITAAQRNILGLLIHRQ
jgi:hypothetical protein